LQLHQSGILLWRLRPKWCTIFSPSQCVLNDTLSQLSFICPPLWNTVASKSYEATHLVVMSILLLFNLCSSFKVTTKNHTHTSKCDIV
jgi:hypothetical protein